MGEYNKYMFEKTNRTIDSYEKKEIILADLFHLGDKKVCYLIYDSETEEELYDDRQEYLEWTSEGCASSLCGRVVESIDVINDRIVVYLKKNREED